MSSLPSAPRSSASPILPTEELTLGNGLSVVLVPMPGVHRAVASLYLRVGSRFEGLEDNGISHFLEHMVFRGTPSLASAHEQALAFERLGATLYAATHVDHGLMSVSVPPANLERVLDLLAEVTLAPRFSDIEVERGIVREEILEDLDDDGRDVDADNLARALLYDSHPLGFTITGGLSALERFDEKMLRAHHARHYTAANAVLCVAGRLSPDQVARSIEKSFGSMPRGERAAAAPAPELGRRSRFCFVEDTSSQTDLRLAFRAVGERDAREPAVEMVLRVLDDGMSTRLYERVCDRLGLCYDVSGMFEAYEDDGVLDIAAGAQHERALLVAKEVLALLHDLAAEGPAEEELAKARDRHLWSVEAMLDDAEAVAGFHGLAALAGIARTPMARHAELEAVTREEVRAAAELLFRPERLGVVAVGLLSEGDEKKLERAVRAF
jgi:predicted Zn-dependent peptidase